MDISLGLRPKNLRGSSLENFETAPKKSFKRFQIPVLLAQLKFMLTPKRKQKIHLSNKYFPPFLDLIRRKVL